jgi:magnesium-transporting ATPase (P-type)
MKSREISFTFKQNHSLQVGAVCNNAEIVNSQLRGQPTEGALITVAMKVIFFLGKQKILIHHSVESSSSS